MKHTEQEYVTFDPFFGDEAEITCRTVKLVKVRKSHACFFGAGSGDGHTIAPGDYARYEKALVDGSYWGRYYLCIPCLNREIAGMHGDDDDDLEGDNG
ncbi:hypothetical protein ASE07_06400 [Noviherbaspirillum sp. Root189]|nr:hypothetical protein ASE07_06400 [Noviherbaspirillum sp. Root189]